jgi:hypothetical protein
MTKWEVRNVHFIGMLNDWKLIHRKIEELKHFTIFTGCQSGFDTYIDNLLPILDQLFRTYQGNVDEHL